MIFNPASKSPLLLLLLLSLSVLSVSSCHFTRSPPGFCISIHFYFQVLDGYTWRGGEKILNPQTQSLLT